MTISERLVLEFDGDVQDPQTAGACSGGKVRLASPGESMTLGRLVRSIVELSTQVTAAIGQSSLDVTGVDGSGSAAVQIPLLKTALFGSLRPQRSRSSRRRHRSTKYRL
jgi:hypothetical protein